MSELTENSHLQSNIKMPVIRGEIALIVIILINSLGVVLMLYSGSGISAISSVPYAFSLVFPKISLGTWTYIFQGLLVLSLMIMRKKFVVKFLAKGIHDAVVEGTDRNEGICFERYLSELAAEN